MLAHAREKATDPHGADAATSTPSEEWAVPPAAAGGWHVGRVWVRMVAGFLLVAGLTGSWVLASSVENRDAERSRDALALSAAEVASRLSIVVQREEDLAVNATAYFLGAADVSNTGLEVLISSNVVFTEWSRSVKALERYPELIGWGKVAIITSSQIEVFLAAASAAAGATIEPVPPGEREFYCLGIVGEARPGLFVDYGFDYCYGTQGANTLAARDSGLTNYQAIDFGLGPKLAVRVPLYRDGVVPSTVETRREAFLGWVGLTFDPKIALDIALQDRPDVAVVLRYHDAISDAEFTTGQPANGATSATVDLGTGWTIQTFGAAADEGVWSNQNALTLLLTTAALSLVVAVLVLQLGTSRARALRTVAERTGQLRHQALHDALTGLPNRALIMDRIEQLLARNRRQGTSGAALFVDLDDFKNVNDTLGHETGDRLLIAVAARLTTTLRDADTIGRMGGDEFVVLIDGAPLKAAPELVAQRLLDVMRQPFDLDEDHIPIAVNTSIGIAIGDRETGGDLLRDADVALYEAKGAGKNQYEVYDPVMQSELSRRLELEFDLRSALDGDQFRLVYLPIYNLDDLHVVGVEALLRWDHPAIGLIEPDEFIPLLEQSGQIQQVGRWVLQHACSQMAAWHAEGDSLDVSVNVSGRQLDHDYIIDDVRWALEYSGLEPGSLIIEITETALMRNAAATAERLRTIKDLGVRIAVDDFGTGYSSLAYLQQFPVDCLKIDRRFTNAITTSPESKALIRTLVQLGKDLGLSTLAEGVETMTEMDQLRREHVNEAQGFLLSKPLDPETFETQLLAPTRQTTEPTKQP